ncbi:hypothetical protein MBLNU230_g4864t1 [Neophaeotheca triangularis]
MSFYDQQPSWSGPNRQPSWDQQAPPSRSGSVSAMSPPPQIDSGAFSSQFEEIDRATDNLTKGGKWFPGSVASSSASTTPSRRASSVAMGRGYDSYGASGSGAAGGDARLGHGPSRNNSGSEPEGGRSGSASGLQGFYQGQRFPPRQSEAEQMLQAKRRMAAQRERELRNYHQEQQYNRNVSGVKSDRAMSPNTMSEEDRRELIARQHRALYGDNSNLYGSESSSSPVGRRQSQDVRVPSSSGARGASPLAFDPFGVPSANNTDNSNGGAPVQMPPRDRENSTTSPAASTLINEQQAPRTSSTSSPTSGSPPLTQNSQAKGNVAPIGTRPAPGQPGNKRSTTPLTPSSLAYGYSSSEQAQAQQQQQQQQKDERAPSVSAASPNPSLPSEGKSGMPGLGNWSGNGGGWGQSGKTLGVQASVWG